MARSYTIGIDLGGTNIAGGVCDENAELVAKHSVPTEARGGLDHVLGRMAALVDDLIHRAQIAKSDVVRIGVGAPGPLSHVRGVIENAPNLPGWTNVPLRDLLGERTGLPVSLENDANAAAFGEFAAGAGRDVNTMVMYTLGTGVGGGIILDGRLWRGPFESGAELGHVIAVPNGRPCPCGQRGCLERYASANAIGERLVEAVQAGEASLLAPRVQAGEPVTSRDVLTAMDAGDALAARIWDEACLHLAIAAVNMQHALNAQLVVLSGGLINAGDKLLDPVREHFDGQSWRIAPDRPQIALATLGGDAGTIGAAALAMMNETA